MSLKSWMFYNKFEDDTVIVYLCFNRKFEIGDFEFSVKT